MLQHPISLKSLAVGQRLEVPSWIKDSKTPLGSIREYPTEYISHFSTKIAFRVNKLDMTPYIRYKADLFRSFADFSSPYTPVASSKILNCPVFYSGSASEFSSGIVFRGVDPAVIPSGSSVKVALYGANFQNGTTVYVDGRAIDSSRVFVATSKFIFVNLDLSSRSGQDGTVSLSIGDSLAYDLSYYDSRSSISTVGSADTLYTRKSGQQLTITGNYLKSFSTAICIFNVTEFGIASPLRVSSGGLATCDLPQVQKSQIVSVDVSYSTPKFDVPENPYGIPTSKGNLYRSTSLLPYGTRSVTISRRATVSSLSVKVVAPGPKIVSAQFSNTGTSIIVTLDKPASIAVGRTASSWTCNQVFSSIASGSNTTVGKLSRPDSPDDCTVQQLNPAELKLNFKGAFTSTDIDAVKPSQLLISQKSSLAALGEQFSESDSSTSVINAPFSPQKPNIVVRAPQVIPSCADLNIDLSGSTGSGGRPFDSTGSSIRFNSTSFVANSNLQSQTLLSSLSNSLSAFTAGSGPSAIMVPSSLMWKPSDPNLKFETFNFGISLTNFLQGASNREFGIRRAADNSVPYIVFDGTNLDKVRVSSQNLIIAAAKPVCGVESPVDFKWTVGPDGCPGLVVPTANTPNLVIPPFALSPATYCDIILKAKYSDQSTWYDFTVNFVTEDDVIYVTPGSSRSIGISQKFVVDAVITDDSQAWPANPNGYTCTWTCQYNGRTCSSAILDALNKCSGNDLTGLISQTGVYSINVRAKSVKSGTTATSIYPSEIEVIDDTIPIVQVTPNIIQTTAGSDTFVLQATVEKSSVASASLVYSWNDCGEDGVLYATLDVTKASNLLVDPTKSPKILKFAPGALQPESVYCVSVTVTDPSTKKSGYARVVFDTTELPSGGHCSIASASSTGSITYGCKFWVGADKAEPLSYRFYARAKGSSSWTGIGSPSTTAFITATFSPGTYQIRADIIDALGSVVSDAVDEFTVSGKTTRQAIGGCGTELCQRIQESQAVFNRTKNIVDASKVLGSVAVGINPQSPEYGTTLTFLESLINEIPIDTQTQGPFLASVLETVAGSNYTLDSSSVSSITALLTKVVDGISNSGKLLSPRSCVSKDVSAALLQIVDKVLGSATALGSSNDATKALIDKVNTLITSIETCTTRRMIAQEVPLVVSSKFISRTVGVADLSSDSKFCTFEVKGKDINTNETSVAYSCGEKTATSFPNSTSLAEVNPNVVDMSFYNVASETTVSVSDATFSVKLSPAFASQYNISGYVPVANDGVDYTLNDYNLHKFQPLCVFYDKTASDPWSTKGCQVAEVTQAGTVVCRCNHLTEFSIGVKQIPSPTTDPNNDSGSGSNTGIIIGATVGAVALVAIAAGAAVYSKAQRKKGVSQRQQTDNGQAAQNGDIEEAREEPGVARNSVQNAEGERPVPQYVPPPSFNQYAETNGQL
jgi:hypothetical protein